MEEEVRNIVRELLMDEPQLVLKALCSLKLESKSYLDIQVDEVVEERDAYLYNWQSAERQVQELQSRYEKQVRDLEAKLEKKSSAYDKLFNKHRELLQEME